ncbi:hypothetical protein BST97_01155 [Nonlabens spongiae]|uniref:Uncharacterized protein n=1 Tax=Nonlabens spongiae TaxID=331648 RepID=A0A1W6MGM5_9FLAO|nr:hypothetical protein [Nonlabens spongiae]ARN76722.1 hypothetical protein BST97_01155 [Nonlabens spongiae]
MFKKVISLLLLFLMVMTIASSAVHHAVEHDDDTVPCEFCIVVHQSQHADLQPQNQVKLARVSHDIYVVESCDAYDAFAKAETQLFSLSIRPPPVCA